MLHLSIIPHEQTQSNCVCIFHVILLFHSDGYFRYSLAGVTLDFFLFVKSYTSKEEYCSKNFSYIFFCIKFIYFFSDHEDQGQSKVKLE
jgi:hypothetical protein